MRNAHGTGFTAGRLKQRDQILEIIRNHPGTTLEAKLTAASEQMGINLILVKDIYYCRPHRTVRKDQQAKIEERRQEMIQRGRLPETR